MTTESIEVESNRRRLGTPTSGRQSDCSDEMNDSIDLKTEGLPQTKFKRNYKACLNCRLRKVKCDLGPVDSPRQGKCARCLRERKDCIFIDSKRGGAGNVSNGKRKRDGGQVGGTVSEAVTTAVSGGIERKLGGSGGSSMPSVSDMLNEKIGGFDNDGDARDCSESRDSDVAFVESTPVDSNANGNLSTMEGALVFLAKAAGTIAKADERDNIDARVKHKQLLQHRLQLRHAEPRSGSKLPGKSELTQDKNSRHGRKPGLCKGQLDLSPLATLSTNSGHYHQRQTIPPLEDGYHIRPRASNKLAQVDFIGYQNGILTEEEAERLVNLFFSTIHPYFPYIPKFLHSADVLSGYPILLCAILTIASRYHSLEGLKEDDGNSIPRNVEVHDRLWVYVQRLVSQSVWAEASTRSIGTVYAFLLFTEWNPRAIHWRWFDYANRQDDINDGEESAGGKLTGSSIQDDSNLAGLGAMRRSYRMAWMLIGSSVRLAQDMGVMEVIPKVFLATHTAEINCVMNIGRRSMLASFMSEMDIDDELVSDEDQDDYRLFGMGEEELQKYAMNHPIKFTLRQKAKIELLQIMYLAHESLYGDKAKLSGLSQIQNLALLNVIRPLLENWASKYKNILKHCNPRTVSSSLSILDQLQDPNSSLSNEVATSLDLEAMIFEYHYAKLFIYSLALNPSPKEAETSSTKRRKRRQSKFNLKLDELSRSASYIEQAFNSANEMLSSAHRVHKMKMLRFMPVRWLTRIVRAVAFIVKCYLTITAHKNTTDNNSQTFSSFEEFDPMVMSFSLISINEIVESIQKAAITLRDCSPDELHLCTRYSNVLMYLCSQMKVNNYERESKVRANDSKRVEASSRDEWNKGERGELHQNSNENETSEQQEFNIYSSWPAKNSKSGTSNQPSSISNHEVLDKLGDSEVMDWFVNDKNVGLDFVGPWTEMIEQQLNLNDNFNLHDMQY